MGPIAISTYAENLHFDWIQVADHHPPHRVRVLGSHRTWNKFDCQFEPELTELADLFVRHHNNGEALSRPQSIYGIEFRS